MSVTPEQIRAVVDAYVAALNTGTAADIAALYAPDARVEDPVGGGQVQDTPEKILQFYRNIEPIEKHAELLDVRVCGNETVFHFTLRMTIGENTSVIDPVDVMIFDDAGRIASMKAYWGPENLRAEG